MITLRVTSLARVTAALLISSIVAISGHVYAGTVEERWSIEVSGEALLEEMTPAETKQLCLNRAKAKAIETVAGVQIISDTVVKDFSLFSEFINAASYAWVKEVKDVRWDPIQDYRRTPDSPPVPLYRVHLKALVVTDKDADSGFTVDLKLNRFTYENGDEMVITVHAARDGYVNVFNVLFDDSVTMIFPSKARTERYVKRGQRLSIPDREAGEQRKLRIFNTSGKATVKESILVIATKDDVDFSLGGFAEAAINEDISKTGSFRMLLEKIKHVPPRERTMAIQTYEIRK